MSCKKSCSQQWTKLLVLLLIVWLVASQQRTWIGPWSGAISPSHGQKIQKIIETFFFVFFIYPVRKLVKNADMDIPTCGSSLASLASVYK